MEHYGTTFAVCCSRLCFGSIPGLEFSLSIPCVVILMFRGMLKLVLPSYVQLNQRCQRPCPNAALQAWLPVLPKITPAIDKMFFTSFFCLYAISRLSLIYEATNISMDFHWMWLWSRSWHQGWFNEVANCCYLFCLLLLLLLLVLLL